MKLLDRQAVEGTEEPTVYIGHRVYRRRDGSIYTCRRWFAEFCRDGQHRYVALGTRHKPKAIRLVHRLLAQLHSGDLVAGRQPKVLIGELRDRYIQFHENQTRSPKTLEKYRLTLSEFLRWCRGRDLAVASAVTEEDFWAFSKHMEVQGLARKTRYDRLIVIKQLFRWAKRLELIPTNRIAGALLKKPPNRQQPCFSSEQVGALLDTATGDEQVAFALMAYAGLRFGEVRELRWSDVQFDQGRGGIILVQRGGANDSTKDHESRRLPMNPARRELLLGHTRSSERVVQLGGKPVEERILLMRLKSLCRQCAFPNPAQFKLHTFRHAFASQCARNGLAYRYALSWLGHSSSGVLDLYYHMFDDSAAAAIGTVVYPSQQHGAGAADWQI